MISLSGNVEMVGTEETPHERFATDRTDAIPSEHVYVVGTEETQC